MRFLLIEPRSCWIGLSVGQAYLSAALKRAGHEVRCLSLSNHREYGSDKLQRYYLEEFQPDLVGYSIYYTSYKSFVESLGNLRKYYNGPVVTGGPQMNLEREQILKDVPELDFGVIGEAEETALELMEALAGGRDWESINGLTYRKNGEVIINPPRKPVQNLDSLPFPDYKSFGIKTIHTYPLSSSRGCPFRCTFCNRNSNIWRPRSPESMIEELKQALDQYQIKEFVIADDAFNIKPERIERFCDLLIEEKINLPWFGTGGRADKLTDSMLKKMRGAGCYSFSVGVETMQPEVYKTINKGETLEEIKSGIIKAKRYGFELNGYFMIGIPGDTPQGVWDTFQKARELDLDYILFSILLPFPGTEVHRELRNNPQVRWLRDYKTVTTGWMFDKEWSRMMSSFELPGFSEKQKVNLFHKIKAKQGDPRPPWRGSWILFSLEAAWYILKYDFWRSPKTFYKLGRQVLRRLVRSKGKTLSNVVIEYEANFLPSLKDLEKRYP